MPDKRLSHPEKKIHQNLFLFYISKSNCYSNTRQNSYKKKHPANPDHRKVKLSSLEKKDILISQNNINQHRMLPF